jgi:hypothetical protein
MTPVYLFHHADTPGQWVVSRITQDGQEPLFHCSTAHEARALTRALRELSGTDPQAKCAALRELGLSSRSRDVTPQDNDPMMALAAQLRRRSVTG